MVSQWFVAHEGNDNFILSVKACIGFILAFFLLDDEAQIVAVQRHEEESTFPRSAAVRSPWKFYTW